MDLAFYLGKRSDRGVINMRKYQTVYTEIAISLLSQHRSLHAQPLACRGQVHGLGALAIRPAITNDRIVS